MSERDLIGRIRKMAAHPVAPKPGSTRVGHPVRLGIGDDCAVLRLKTGFEALVTTDFSLEGVHFRRDWHSAEQIGHRCLLRGLSDIAAMGGEPVAAFLSLALPKGVSASWVDRFYKRLLKLAKKYGVGLAGGDTAESRGGVLADIVVVGQVPAGKALLRSGARTGDGIYVTGALGGAAAELKTFRGRGRPRHTILAEPRIEVGQALRGIASACIDVSDGLSTDLSHICEESGAGAVVEAQAIPVASGATLKDALHGGDDYELLFTSSKAVPERIAGVKVSLIGEIVRGKSMNLIDAAGKTRMLEAKGWEHFAGR